MSFTKQTHMHIWTGKNRKHILHSITINHKERNGLVNDAADDDDAVDADAVAAETPWPMAMHLPFSFFSRLLLMSYSHSNLFARLEDTCANVSAVSTAVKRASKSVSSIRTINSCQ